jgi:hypothetical protein
MEGQRCGCGSVEIQTDPQPNISAPCPRNQNRVMILRMLCRKSLKRILLGIGLTLAVLAAAPTRALADDEPEIYDARLEGYAQKVQLDAGSTALTWLVLIVLGVLTVGVLFKDAKRSHLD